MVFEPCDSGEEDCAHSFGVDDFNRSLPPSKGPAQAQNGAKPPARPSPTSQAASHKEGALETHSGGLHPVAPNGPLKPQPAPASNLAAVFPHQPSAGTAQLSPQPLPAPRRCLVQPRLARAPPAMATSEKTLACEPSAERFASRRIHGTSGAKPGSPPAEDRSFQHGVAEAISVR